MAFTVGEFRDLLRILEERPEWRSELRRLVLTDELLTLPDLVRALVEAQQRTEERLAVMADTLQTLILRVDVLTQDVGVLKQDVSSLKNDVSRLKGTDLERSYREHAHAYFSPMARRLRVLSGEELQTLLEEALQENQLTESETLEILRADLVVRGRRRGDNAEVYLVVEVSWTVDPYNVERAVRRSTLLSKIGTPALAVVAGEGVTQEAVSLSEMLHVWQVTNGHVVSPQDGSPQTS